MLLHGGQHPDAFVLEFVGARFGGGEEQLPRREIHGGLLVCHGVDVGAEPDGFCLGAGDKEHRGGILPGKRQGKLGFMDAGEPRHTDRRLALCKGIQDPAVVG